MLASAPKIGAYNEKADLKVGLYVRQSLRPSESRRPIYLG